ncbi:MAG: hypothetical protein FJ102_13400 [Deltaproteobacteria bacterium]|nr:hypothetical protein [Deltaproteobacteria bacterium]
MLFLLACDAPERHGGTRGDAGSDTAPAAAVEHVVIVVLDGAREAETFGTESTAASAVAGQALMADFAGPYLPRGALLTGAIAAGMTITAPGHADLLTGHPGLFAMMPSAAGPGDYRPEFPTLFEAVESWFPGRDTYLVTNTEHLESLGRSVYPPIDDEQGATFVNTSGVELADDASVFTAVQEALASQPPLLLANLHEIDREGHSTTDAGAYGRALGATAPGLAALWTSIEASEMGGTTLLVVLSDHGRHDWGGDTEGRESLPWDYAGHGDQCACCREIPMFFMGPGVRQGVEIDTPVTLHDVGATVAAALGVPLPHATGRVIAEAFEQPPAARPGAGWLAASGDNVATVEWTGEASARADLLLDGSLLDSGFLLEDPSLGAGVACWRALEATPPGTDWPWTARCRAAGTELVLPVAIVASHWRASPVELDDGRVALAYADNPDAVVDASERATIVVAAWNPVADDVVAAIASTPAVFPGNPSLATLDGRVYAAWAASDVGDGGTVDPARYTRHVVVAEVLDDGTLDETWRAYDAECDPMARCDAQVPTLDDHAEADTRMEFPALAARDGSLALAYVSWGGPGVTVHVVTGPDFGTPVRVDDSGRVLGHVEPTWGDGVLYYARLGVADTVEVCAWNGSTTCIDTGATAIADLAATATGALAALHRDEAWAVEGLGL